MAETIKAKLVREGGKVKVRIPKADIERAKMMGVLKRPVERKYPSLERPGARVNILQTTTIFHQLNPTGSVELLEFFSRRPNVYKVDGNFKEDGIKKPAEYLGMRYYWTPLAIAGATQARANAINSLLDGVAVLKLEDEERKVLKLYDIGPKIKIDVLNPTTPTFIVEAEMPEFYEFKDKKTGQVDAIVAGENDVITLEVRFANAVNFADADVDPIAELLANLLQKKIIS